MTRQTRTRTKLEAWPEGKYTQRWNGVDTLVHNTDSNPYYTREICEDSHGRPVVPSTLNITKEDRRLLIPINGAKILFDNFGRAEGYYPSGLRNSALGHVYLPGRPSPSADMTTLLAKTNPSRPGITPLGMIQNVKELPGMLKDVGRLLTTKKKRLTPREFANQNLALQFGWLPLISDIRTLLDFGSYVDRRAAEIHKLYSSSGLKRRIQLGRWSGEDVTNYVSVESHLGLDVGVKRSTFTKSHRWGVVHWIPSVLPSHYPSDAEILSKAKLVTSGFTVEGLNKGAWDLLPWTWLIDWFSNAGDFMQTHSNTVPATPTGACIMTQTDTIIQYRVVELTQGYSGGGGLASLVSKERYVGGGSLSAKIPYIGINRLSILGSLFVQRFKR